MKEATLFRNFQNIEKQIQQLNMSIIQMNILLNSITDLLTNKGGKKYKINIFNKIETLIFKSKPLYSLNELKHSIQKVQSNFIELQKNNLHKNG